jgi:formate dehydrogenase iron-sulfur subunit
MSAPARPTRPLSRRQFLRLSATAVGAAALAAAVRPASASTGIPRDAQPGMLIDISRCAGCGACQRACGAANKLHPSTEQQQGLSTESYTFVQRVNLEGGDTRWVKRQCMHCIDAACASACPVSALHQTPEGPIAYRAERCLGCRYCMVSCPFGVPRFEWQKGLTPEIRKCMFCIERQRAGKTPACAAACPSGALKFGARGSLLQEAHARIAGNSSFVDHVYGEQEAGGTAMLYISDVPFEQLGFRTDVTQQALPSYTWQVMSKLPVVVGGLAVVLGGASAITRRRNGPGHDEPDWVRAEAAGPDRQTPHDENNGEGA